MSPSTNNSVALGAILLLAAGLRWYGLDAGLWYDEIITLTDYVRLAPLELAQSYGSANNHILYSWLSKLSVVVGGESPTSLRFPAFVFGVLSVWLLYHFATIAMSRNWALVSTLLLAVSYHHVWFSQNARSYTGMLFFAMLSSIFLEKGLRLERYRWWLLYALCVAFSLLLHLSSIVFFAVQGLVAVAFIALRRNEDGRPFDNRKLWKCVAAALVAAFGATTVLLLPVLPALTKYWFAKISLDSAASGAVVITDWINPFWTLLEVVRSFGVLGALFPLILIPVVVGAWRLARTNPVLILPYLLHIPAAILFVSAVGMNLWPRYFFADIGALLCCSVYGSYAIVGALSKRLGPDFMPGLAGVVKSSGTVVVVIVFVVLLGRNYSLPKQDFTGALNFVKSRLAPGDVVATIGLAERAYLSYLAPDWRSLDSNEELERLAENHRRIWIVTTFEKHLRANYPGAYLTLKNDFEEAAVFSGTLADSDVSVFSFQADGVVDGGSI